MMKFLLDGKRVASVGWTDAGTLLISNGEEYLFEPVVYPADTQTQELADLATRYMELRPAEFATLTQAGDAIQYAGLTVYPQERLSMSLAKDANRDAFAKGRPMKSRSWKAWLVYAALVLHNRRIGSQKPETPRGVAFFRGHDEPILLKTFRRRIVNTANPQSEERITLGQITCANDYQDVSVKGRLFDLRRRQAARFCIKFLVEKKAIDATSARGMRDEIDPYVRQNTALEPNPRRRIQDYFNGNPYRQMCTGLIAPSGRTGRYFLKA